MKVFFVFFLVLVFGVVSSHGRTHEYYAPTPFKTSMTVSYDEFQQWPKSYCRVRSKRSYCRDFYSYFTVHGLWAQCKGRAANCEGGKPFNPSCQLNPDTVSNLKKYWPNLIGEDKKFWTHEYDTHASCIWLFQADPENYFSSTLKLAKKYNVTTMLLKAGIQPHMEPYSIIDIEEAIFDAINVYPTLECNYADGTIQLFQIYLCFDKTASKLLNCTQRYKNCPRKNWDDLISFPFPQFPVS